MLKDELPDDLVAFLKTDRRLRYDARACEIGVFTLRALDEVQEIELAVSAEQGEATCVMRGLDLLKTCEAYDPRGMLVYIPSLRKYGSYDGEKQSLVTFRGMSWSDFLASPTRYINAGWFEDEEVAEETFNEADADRIVEVCSAANATEAGFLADVLADKGIRAEVVGATLGTAGGWLPLGEATAPRLWVREGDSGRAREIVNEVNNPRRESGRLSARDDEDVEFPCQECGIMLTFPAASRGFVETCPACGNYVDVPDDRQGSLLGDAKDADAVIVEDSPVEPPSAAETAAPAVPQTAPQPRAARNSHPQPTNHDSTLDRSDCGPIPCLCPLFGFGSCRHFGLACASSATTSSVSLVAFANRFAANQPARACNHRIVARAVANIRHRAPEMVSRRCGGFRYLASHYCGLPNRLRTFAALLSSQLDLRAAWTFRI